MQVLQSISLGIKRVLNVGADIRLSLFLALCLILGGTSQDIVTFKLPLYLISLILIGISINSVTKESRIWKLKSFLFIWAVFLFVHLLYLIPLPPSLWTTLGGRESIAKGFEMLNVSLPWLPMSLTPEKTLFSLFDFFPPLAVIMMMGTVVSSREFRLALWTLCVGVIISVFLGLLQVSGGFPEFYLYDITNFGTAVGTFSNANHYGVFLLMCIPLIVFLADYQRSNDYNRQNAINSFCVVAVLSILLGIGISGSLGAYLLIIPVLAATLFLWSSGKRLKQFYLIGIIISILGLLLFDMFIWNGLQSEITDMFTSTDKASRTVMFENTYEIGKMFFPFGSGPGSFEESYRLFEVTTRRTVPHAHNEYIEIFAEFGIIGILGLLGVLSWLAKHIFSSMSGSGIHFKLARYISISICLIIIHSFVDYSLRTIAIMTVVSFCVCMLVLSNKNVSLL